MLSKASEHKEVWKTIILFLTIVTIFSSIFHYAIINLYPSRMYIGAIMWCPAIAAILTMKIKGRPLSSLNWNWGDWKYIRLSYLIPVFYVIITYSLIWVFALGGIANESIILDWAEELKLVGFGTLNSTFIVIIAVILLGTLGVIRSMATTLGEEIGWRGFFIYELRKVLSFTGVSLFSGIVWALWHWPIIVYYGSGNIAFEMTTLIIGSISMSFIMTYYTFKSKSIWPAVIFHAVSNVYIQKIFPPLTIKIEGKEYWLGESGLMITIIVTLFAIYFWRKALKENL